MNGPARDAQTDPAYREKTGKIFGQIFRLKNRVAGQGCGTAK